MIYCVVSGQYSYTIADPLCSRVIKKNSGYECNYNYATNKSFDQECGQTKALYKNALHVFNNTRCDRDRNEACRLKMFYKNTIKRAARSFRYKDFWRHFTTWKKSENTNVPIQDFKSHFQDMFDKVQHNLNEDAEYVNESNDFDSTDPIYEELDTPITYSEVRKAIKSLNICKTTGEDKLLK